MADSVNERSVVETGSGERAEEELVPAQGYTRPVSVGLKESELGLLDEAAERLGVARNAVMRYLIRDGLARLKTGQLEIPVKKQTSNSIEW